MPDIHRLLPESGLYVIGEHFQRVEHCLLAPKGASMATVKRAHSHPMALGQVLNLIRERNLQPVIEADTAGAAQIIAARNSAEDAAIASANWRPRSTGWRSWRAMSRTARDNTTRFYVMSRDRVYPPLAAPDTVTTFVFRVRSVPAALYKALGGFATNGVNMTKLESYMVGGRFSATQFLCDVDGHPDSPALRRVRGAGILHQGIPHPGRVSGACVQAGAGGGGDAARDERAAHVTRRRAVASDRDRAAGDASPLDKARCVQRRRRWPSNQTMAGEARVTGRRPETKA